MDTITNRQNSALVSSYDYDYDSNGNRTEQVEINGAAAETTTYGFDGLDRLTSVTYPDQTVTYTYDLAYNRKTEIAADLTATTLKDWQYQYNDRHQLTDIQDQLDAAQSISYGYDNNGNQTSKTQGTEITNFVFDARDDMRQVQVGGSTVGQFLYDAAGLRIEKAGDRGIERYTYDDLSVLRQFDENNQTLAKFDYGPDRLLSLTGTADGTQFYLMDALNSVVNLANASGAVQARYQYDAWGNKRNEVGSSWNRFGFTGHEHDTESGLIYAKARFYDPETGRFLGQDAWEGDNQLPPSLHKYLYAYGNPTKYTDPSGNCVWDLCVGEAVVIAALAGVIVAEGSYIVDQLWGTEEQKENALPRAVQRGGMTTAGFMLLPVAIEAAPIATAIASDGIVAGGLATAPESTALITGLLAEDAAIGYGSYRLGKNQPKALPAPQATKPQAQTSKVELMVENPSASGSKTIYVDSKGTASSELPSQAAGNSPVLPEGYHTRTVNGQTVVARNPGRKEDLQPISITDEGNVYSPLKSDHGNTAGNQEAILYERYDADGNFLKHGVTQDIDTRYTKKEFDGGYLIQTDRGPRKEILQKERELVETDPGPLNKEPWAGKRKQDE